MPHVNGFIQRSNTTTPAPLVLAHDDVRISRKPVEVAAIVEEVLFGHVVKQAGVEKALADADGLQPARCQAVGDGPGDKLLSAKHRPKHPPSEPKIGLKVLATSGPVL